MDVLLIILFILQLIFNIYFLIKSIKSKDNRNWLILFSINISSIIKTILCLSFKRIFQLKKYLYIYRNNH